MMEESSVSCIYMLPLCMLKLCEYRLLMFLRNITMYMFSKWRLYTGVFVCYLNFIHMIQFSFNMPYFAFCFSCFTTFRLIPSTPFNIVLFIFILFIIIVIIIIRKFNFVNVLLLLLLLS